eukprot:m.30375 g.30375  ORF g.30375 m.30375 type:complete len:353 (-) comp14542_c0_seq4:81-1139(-)
MIILLLLLCVTTVTTTNTTTILGADPKCSTGILSYNSCCCPKECETCGGENCQDHPGGLVNCCCSVIEAEGRSCNSNEPPCWLGPVAPVPVNPKRGFVGNGHHPSCDDPLLLNTSGWFYDYNVNDPYRARGLPGNCALANQTDAHRFTPMNWCLDSMDQSIPNYVDRKYFLGFNEPNNHGQCDIPPKVAAEAWAKIKTKWNTSILVSPATAGNGIEWYDQFFGNCTALYGKNGCNLSHLATHDYSCDANHTMTYLKQLYDRYNLTIWLTEFSCGDAKDHKPTADHMTFMAKILPLLDTADYIYRYSWMSARDSNNLRGLVQTNNSTSQATLTSLGRLWNTGKLEQGFGERLW